MENKRDFSELAQMIKGISRKASKQLFSREPEDIEQDLWVKVLETEKRKGHEIDLSLAAKVCWDYVKDMIDYDQRRNHISVDLSGTVDEREQGVYVGDGDFIGVTQEDGKDWASNMMIDDFFNRYPKGTKERLFLDFWGNASGVRPNTDAIPPKSRTAGGYTESNLAKMLGYSGTSSGGYKKFRAKMLAAIKDYFEVD